MNNLKMVEENAELLLCPFCGNKPHLGSLGGDKENWCIWCDCQMACAETGVAHATKEGIIKLWNTRTRHATEPKRPKNRYEPATIAYTVFEEAVDLCKEAWRK